jgi:hypothetical protein
MDFKITGTKDISLARGNTITLPLKIFYLGGKKEDVTVRIIAPSTLSTFVDRVTGKPDFEFNTTLVLDSTPINAELLVTVEATSTSGKIVTRSFKIMVTDPPNHYPVIVLNGLSSYTWTLNDPWTEPGFTATDFEDGDITSHVIVTGTVNADYASLYQLTYTVTDSQGYTATKKRTVSVKNSIDYLQGTYSCSTTIQNGGNYTWLGNASIGVSPTINNHLVLSRLSDCYGFNLDATVSGSSIILPLQLQAGSNTQPVSTGLCFNGVHSLSGNGSVAPGVQTIITLIYTDQYEDSTGAAFSFIKTDTYRKL